MNDHIAVLSLGWGVQSFTLAAMSALGDLPPLDYAVHADTGYEQAHTYAFAAAWTGWLEQRGVKVVTVKDETGRRRPIDQWGGVMLPAYGAAVERWGNTQLSRQCTDDWKRMPVRRFIRAHGKTATLWLGISVDEVERSTPSRVGYVKHAFPLLDRRMNRGDCVAYLKRHELDVPHKSSCYFCPYHRHADWMDIKHHGNGDWQKCLDVDDKIRHARPTFELYLHRSMKPLADATDESAGVQLPLIMDECTGSCWL